MIFCTRCVMRVLITILSSSSNRVRNPQWVSGLNFFGGIADDSFRGRPG